MLQIKGSQLSNSEDVAGISTHAHTHTAPCLTNGFIMIQLNGPAVKEDKKNTSE